MVTVSVINVAVSQAPPPVSYLEAQTRKRSWSGIGVNRKRQNGASYKTHLDQATATPALLH